MTVLNPKYVTSTPLQWLFRDKDTGLPLASGIVTFYKQDDQTVLKPIFQLDNSSPTGFSELNNPIALTSIGTFADNNGNDIIPYFYPFDDAGNPELYYVTVYSSGGVLQFTRMDWPPNEGSGNIEPSSQNDIINYVPNGQFLLHNNFPVSAVVGSDTVQYIAQGGWTFERETIATSADTVSFVREVSASTNPDVDANPRYFFQISTTGTDTNYARKDLCLTYPDVNKFAGDPTVSSSNYTFSFQGVVLSGGSTIVDIRLRKNFGVGGSTATDISLGTIELASVETLYNLSFTFGDNDGDNVGAADDDYLQICIRFPNSAQIVDLTDFVLTPGATAVVAFPQTPNADFIRDSTIGWLPTPNSDGSNLYLPIVLSSEGCIFDDSEIGCVLNEMAPVIPINALPCDGSVYTKAAYSAIGVPYSRLFNKLFLGGVVNAPLYGTGIFYVTAAINLGATSQIVLSTNNISAQTNPANGASSPGFTYSTLITGSATSFGYKAYVNSGAIMLGVSLFTAIPLAGVGALAGTSGMTVVSLKNTLMTPQYYSFYLVALSAATLANPGNPGKYWTFRSDTTAYYMWFQITNETDPAPRGTGIKVVLVSTMATTDVANVIYNAFQGHQVNSITVGAASTITGGNYFQFKSNATNFAPWYKKAGIGVAPAVINPIEIDLVGTETAAQVATLTQTAINSLQFATPDLRGLFLRGSDPTRIWDFDNQIRGNLIPNSSSNLPGSVDVDGFGLHTHGIVVTATGAADSTVSTGGGADHTAAVTQAAGEPETNPVNAYVNFYIKY